jgi:hypothetical protein
MEHTDDFYDVKTLHLEYFYKCRRMETQLEALSRLVPRLGPAAGPRLQAG